MRMGASGSTRPAATARVITTRLPNAGRPSPDATPQPRNALRAILRRPQRQPMSLVPDLPQTDLEARQRAHMRAMMAAVQDMDWDAPQYLAELLAGAPA